MGWKEGGHSFGGRMEGVSEVEVRVKQEYGHAGTVNSDLS